MQRTRMLGIAASLCLVLGASACGGSKGDDDSEADLVDDISQTLQDNGVDADIADCQAAAIVDEVGFDKLKDVDLADEQPPEDLQDDITAAAAEATTTCEGTSG
jgi:hypothetical protein